MIGTTSGSVHETEEDMLPRFFFMIEVGDVPSFAAAVLLEELDSPKDGQG